MAAMFQIQKIGIGNRVEREVRSCMELGYREKRQTPLVRISRRNRLLS